MDKKDFKELEQHEKPLTLRERITIYMCFLVIRIVKPTSYSHDIDEIENKVMSDLK